jgi:Domain of Unknown Function (DUF1080)
MPRRTVVVAALVAALSLAQDVAPQDSATCRASAWKPLFDGTSSAGWRGFRAKEFPAKGWTVESGALHHAAGAGGGDIVTVDEYGDFELRFEWKVGPGANSGILYRVGEDEDAAWRTGPEYQILDDDKHADGKEAKSSAASMYALYEPAGKQLKPVGEFNEGGIVVRGGRIEHWLNGTRVVSCDLGGPGPAAKIAASKFKDMPGFAKRAEGRIALQDHGDDVWYRNIRIRTFTKAPERRLFDGASFKGWTHFLTDGGKLEDVWNIVDGVLVCKGHPDGYIRTTEDFENFILHVDWRFNPVTKKEGNSGVLFRMIGPDKVWPKSVEAQLHSRSAGDFYFIDGIEGKSDPNRTRGNNVKKLSMNENPVGEWNTYEIDVDGGSVELRVNGKVLNRATDVQKVAGKIALQSEGTEIQFRHISIIPIR